MRVVLLVLVGVGLPALLGGCGGSETVAPTGAIALAANSTTIAVTKGNGVTAALSLTRSGGFTGAVDLTYSGMPTGVTVVANPTALASGVTTTSMTFTASTAAAVGTSTITVVGKGTGIPDASLAFTLTIAAAPPTINGNWVGITLQGAPIRFTIRDLRLVGIYYQFAYPTCRMLAPQTSNFAGFSNQVSSAGVFAFTVRLSSIHHQNLDGTLNTNGTGSGTLVSTVSDSSTVCARGTTMSTTWTATLP